MCIEIQTYICLGDVQAVVVVYSPLNVHGCNLHMFIPLMWFYALQTEDLQVMLGQHTHTHTFNKHWHHQPIDTFTEASTIIWRWCPSSPALVVA